MHQLEVDRAMVGECAPGPLVGIGLPVSEVEVVGAEPGEAEGPAVPQVREGEVVVLVWGGGGTEGVWLRVGQRDPEIQSPSGEGKGPLAYREEAVAG